MAVSVLRTGSFALTMLLLAAASGQAQVLPPSAMPPPPPGFVPPFEIMRTVRAAGFHPTAPPLREGTTYVVRAMDFRGILMRVVVDANTGAIRAVNRIVPGPGMSGQIGMMPPYSASLDDMPPYGVLPEFNGADAPDETSTLPPPSLVPRPPAFHPTTRATVTILPPLPRPRPAELAARKPVDDAKSETKPETKPETKSETKSETKPEVKPQVKPQVKPEITTALPTTPLPTTPPTPAPVKPSKETPPLMINN